MEKKYFKCSKCGVAGMVESDFKDSTPIPCMQLAPWRTSGICGGSYTIPITQEEFELAQQKFKTCKNCKHFSEHNVKGFGYCEKVYDFLDVEDRKGNLLSNFAIMISEDFGCIKFEQK